MVAIESVWIVVWAVGGRRIARRVDGSCEVVHHPASISHFTPHTLEHHVALNLKNEIYAIH